MYNKDKLKEYIKRSELKIFSDNIRVRLSKDLAVKYDEGIYDNYLKLQDKYIKMINDLGIVFPSNASPKFYIYIVPMENYAELLRVPKIFDSGAGAGRPVNSYDLDGFNSSYGISTNLIENYQEKNIMRIENDIHELAHIVHSQFFSRDQWLNEGFAESLVLYIMDYENIFEEHKNVIESLSEEKILTAEELIQEEKIGAFGEKSVLPNKSCSFRYSYISSYLLVRGILESISKNFGYNKKEAIQYFLEMIRQSSCFQEYLVFEIADEIGMSKDELLNGKILQLEVIKSISKERGMIK